MSPSKVTKNRGKWLIHGKPGTGKTTLGSTIAMNQPALLIDLIGERGTASFDGMPQCKNIDVVQPDTIEQLNQVLTYLDQGDHKYQAVILDSLTSVRRMALAFFEKRSGWTVTDYQNGKDKPTDLKTWGMTKSVAEDVGINTFDLASGRRSLQKTPSGKPKHPMDVVLISQVTTEGDPEKGDPLTQTIDVQKGARSAIIAASDFMLHTYLEVDPSTEYNEDPKYKHVVRVGSHSEMATKSRIPPHLQGKVPRVLGRKRTANLHNLSILLGIHEMPKTDDDTSSK